MKAQPHIEIFYADICGLCHQAMNYFRSRDLAFTPREVFWEGEAFIDSPNTREMYRRCGVVDFVPQIFINGRHISGWRTLEPLIESGEIERILYPDSPPV